MDAYQLAIYAGIAAEIARMEGMKCANIQAHYARKPQPYKPDDFFAVADELSRLTVSARNS